MVQNAPLRTPHCAGPKRRSQLRGADRKRTKNRTPTSGKSDRRGRWTETARVAVEEAALEGGSTAEECSCCQQSLRLSQQLQTFTLRGEYSLVPLYDLFRLDRLQPAQMLNVPSDQDCEAGIGR